MTALPGDAVLYGQLDDYQPLTTSQVASLRARAETAEAWFERFDLPRIAIACRPRDEDPLRSLGVLLHDAVVRAHPRFDEFRYELIGAVGICRTTFQTEWLRACPCMDVCAELDVIPDAVLDGLLTPAPIAALLEFADGMALGELERRVRPALDRAGPEIESAFIQLLAPAPSDAIDGPSSEEEREFDEDDLYLEAMEGGWSSPAALELALSWPDVVLPWGASAAAQAAVEAAFHHDVLRLLSLPPDLLVPDQVAGPY
jgi:hypothetical protein